MTHAEGGPREYDLTQDWDRLRRTGGTLVRRPLTVFAITAFVAALTLGLTLSRTPTYVATASLRVGDELTKSPILDELDIPTGTTDIGEALTILSSHDLAARIVRPPSNGELATTGNEDYTRRMGLTTWVEDEGRAPLKALVRGLVADRSSDFRLFAAVEAEHAGAPGELRVRFVSPTRCVLSRVSSKPGIEWPEDRPELHTYAPGAVMRYAGCKVRLETRGRQDGRSFLLRRSSVEDAAAMVQARLSVSQVAGYDGLVRVTVTDTHPARAAEIARAVVATYMELDVAATLERADRTIAYVQGELAEREEELEGLDREISRILELFPDAIELDKAFTQLNERQSATGSHLASIARKRRSLERIDEALREGDRAAVSRMGAEFDDPVVRRYLDLIGVLEDERMRIAREGPGELASTLQVKIAEDRRRRTELEGKLATLEAILERLESGDRTVLGQLGEENAKDGAVTVDALTLQYLADFGSTERRARELEATYTSAYSPLLAAQREIDAIVGRIVEHLSARRAGVEAELRVQEEFIADWEALVTTHQVGELERIERAIENHWRIVARAISARVSGIREQEGGLVRELDQLRGRIAKLPEAQRLLKEPSDRREALETVVTKLREKREGAAIARAGAVPNARLIDPARPPGAPSSPSTLLGLVVGLLLGGIASVLWVGARETTRARLADAADIEEAAGLRVIGAIPPFPGALRLSRSPWKHFHALSDEPGGTVSEAYRSVRARLRQLETRGRGLHTLGVTSCLRGEGRTSTSTGIAMAFASEGKRVLLVDADLRRPTLHEAFSLEPGPGLGELLEDAAAVSDCVLPTGTPNLHVLRAGTTARGPSQAMASSLAGRLAELEASWDLIVLDLPPVIGAPDVESVAHSLDGLLLLHGERVSPARKIVEAVADRLWRSGARPVGVVRNGAASDEVRVKRRQAA